ncbi:hypothetical protein ALC57_01213 [Trachymyrmex cornetzi]|uniref:Uncharacterized protein n=1 Tax=Trachymyrmex cornetzi TaxID=471704 RepID=A0A151JQ25_9HYME|nr:hypothetical protein ALC57_01213 [Trachymyrmex cornetzi]
MVGSLEVPASPSVTGLRSSLVSDSVDSSLAAPGVAVSPTDLVAALASLSSVLSSLDDRIARLESRLGAGDRIERGLDALDGRLAALDSSIQRLVCVERKVDGLSSALDVLSSDASALRDGQQLLDDRLSRLERDLSPRAVVPSCVILAGSDDLVRPVERMEGERRDHEIIVFGLPESVSEDAAALMTVLASFLGLTLTPGEIVTSFRIPVRGASRGRPLVRLNTVARRNELLERARRQRARLVASLICPSWPGDSVSLRERATAAERRVFGEVSRLARLHGIGYVWMRRGVTYFRVSEGSRAFCYVSPEETLRVVGFGARSPGPSLSALSLDGRSD